MRASLFPGTDVSMIVRPSGPAARLHLFALRSASKAGHIRTAARILRRLFPSSDDVEVTFESGGALRIPLADVYWSRIVVGWEHEPEVRTTIDLAKTHQAGAILLDAGANIGYWGAWFAGKLPVIAVEAVPATYRTLRDSAMRNGFIALNYAIWRESGTQLRVSWETNRKARASVIYEYGAQSTNVPTITIDDVYSTHGQGRPLIVKLDVEGAEIAAIDGASHVLDRALWLYEDHGTGVTERLWNAGLATARMSHGSLSTFDDLVELEAIKAATASDRAARPRGVRAYNFVAFSPRGPFSSMGSDRRFGL
jgi:FkbM family methyltransferase